MSVITNRVHGVDSVDIEEAVRIRLQHNPYRAIRRVTCHLSNGILYLRGTVATFHHKQLAQAAVMGIDGIHLVVNEVEVQSP